MMFNVNRPTSEGQLAALFTGNPHLTPQQVDSNLFTSSAQGHGYIQQQGKNLGIGDPAQYYSQQQLAQTMATQQNGAQAEFARQTGQFSPTSLPGQLANRDKMWGAAMDNDVLNAQKLAALQVQQREKSFPLPAVGMQPTLSPVMQEDMRQQGLADPMAYLMRQRLGGMATPSVAGGEMLPKPVTPFATAGPVMPDALYDQPAFQNRMRNDPRMANQVFSGLTGGDLGGYAEGRMKSAGDERNWKVKTLRDMLSEGKAQRNEDGSLTFREMIPDPSGSGRLVLGPNYGKGDAFQQSLNKVLPYADSDASEFQKMAQRRAIEAPKAPVAALQNAPKFGEDNRGVPMQLQTNTSPSPLFDETMNAIVGDVGRIFTGGEQTHLDWSGQGGKQWAHGAGDFTRPQGRAITHARPALANNPQFQELMRRDPEKARRIILAIQMGDNSPLQTNRPRTGPYMQ